MRLEELRVKILSLAAEIAIIRKRVKKYTLMCKTPELASRVLDHEGRPVKELLHRLRTHMLELSREQRAASLARAFLQGKPWSKVEPHWRVEVRWSVNGSSTLR